jgi:hypothetical protein
MNSVNEKCCSKPDEVLPLKEVDGAEIVSLVDNCVDFLSTIEREEVYQVRKWVKERKGDAWMKEHFRLPVMAFQFSSTHFAVIAVITYCLMLAAVQTEWLPMRIEWDWTFQRLSL